MEIRGEFLVILLGASIVTLLPRVLPLVFSSRFPMPDRLLRFLHHIPVAVMAALLAQSLMTVSGGKFPAFDPVKCWALIPTLAAAVLTRSLLAAVAVGILSMAVLRLFY